MCQQMWINKVLLRKCCICATAFPRINDKSVYEIYIKRRTLLLHNLQLTDAYGYLGVIKSISLS